MNPDRFDRLTDKQRECLRLVFMHRSSKEIARELGVGSDAVDQRIKTAMRTLGVESRTEAARLLAQHEGMGPYQRLVYQRPDVAPDPVPPSFDPQANEGERTAEEAYGTAVREEQAMFQTMQWRPARALPFPLPVEGERRNDLGPLQRLAWIVGIAIGTAIGFGAFLTGLQALDQLVR